jgi:hypothetical protein
VDVGGDVDAGVLVEGDVVAAQVLRGDVDAAPDARTRRPRCTRPRPAEQRDSRGTRALLRHSLPAHTRIVTPHRSTSPIEDIVK